MVKKLENEIWDLQKELAEIKKNQSLLRLQPCLGDSEIKAKEEKFDELDRRVKALNDTIRNTTRKRQLMIYQAAIRENNESMRSA